MGSAESKQVAGRLHAANLSKVNFPTSFKMSYKGMRALTMVLGDDNNPSSIVSMPGGWYGDLILYDGPSEEASPVAVARSGGKMGFYDRIELAAASPGQMTTREELRCRSNGWSMAYTFAMAIDQGSLPERFIWRNSRSSEVKGLGEYSRGWKLVRLGEREEVVAVGAEAKLSSCLSKAGAFQFVGTGATGKLGKGWETMAVVSFLRIVQKEMQAAITAAGA
ncbi:hypothetical protein HIM_08028 [Hirsutella minnesotensis 3608]|uniref:Uncharacterized protein n=1 Tax=Hirsutella minnesotensis 3608 TaxID=1043627 RepID=A0A0F8A3Z1_9HYPO|nr:hypothetical protein HIM_08028 [Hirsutella minnesotensis 3608]